MASNAFLALLLAASAPAPAAPPEGSAAAPPGQLRFVAELRVEPSKEGTRLGADLQPLSTDRFFKVGMVWERRPDKRPSRPRFTLLDLAQQRYVELVIPVDELPRAHQERLGTSPPPELVHHDGQVTSMLFREPGKAKQPSSWFCQFDHRTGRFSELVRLAALGEGRYLHPLGFDPQEAHFYYAVEVYAPEASTKHGPTSLELSRVRLGDRAVDWQMALELPRRARQLAVRERRFSHDGTRLALVEHNEGAYPKAIPPQQVYLLDLVNRRTETYPTPLRTYGLEFSRDDRYLLLGSNEQGRIVRVDLAARRVDLEARTIGMIQGFALTPSGRSLLVFANTALVSPKVVEVRRVDTLALRTAVPVRLLHPGHDGLTRAFASTGDGRWLVSPIIDRLGFPEGNGVRLYAVPDDVEAPGVEGTSPEALRAAQGVVLAKQQAEASKIEVVTDPAEEARQPRPTFLPIVTAPGGDVLYAGTRSGNSDGDYRPGRTRPVVVRLDPSGKRRWEVALPGQGFLDHTGARVAATADGGCVAQLQSYVHPGQTPVTRLVKLDARGRTVWDLPLRGGGRSEPPSPDQLELQPDGTILLTGRTSTSPERSRPWTAVVSPAGKVLSEVVGE